MFHKHPQKSGQLVEHGEEFPFLFIAFLGNPSQDCSLQLGSCALHNSKGHHSRLYNGSGAPGIGQCDGPASAHLLSHLHAPSLWKEKGVGSLWVHFFLFFFFAKGLLPVPELWLSPPGLSLQLTVHWRTERMHVCA